MEKPRSRRLAAFGMLWAVVSGGVILTPGCYGRNCEGDTQTYGAEPNQGEMIDNTTWASTREEGTWLPFPRQRYWIFNISALGGRTPEVILPYIAAQAQPNDAGGNSTLGAGDIALQLNVRPGGVDIQNSTCSDYYLRLVVFTEPTPPNQQTDGGTTPSEPVVDTSDAGPDGAADASPSDAGTDAEAGP